MSNFKMHCGCYYNSTGFYFKDNSVWLYTWNASGDDVREEQYALTSELVAALKTIEENTSSQDANRVIKVAYACGYWTRKN